MRKRKGRIPPLIQSSRLIASADHAQRVGKAAIDAYASKIGRWRPLPEWNKAIYHATVWWSSNKPGCHWPPNLIMAVAHGLGVYDRASRRNVASMAAQLEGRYLALRRFPVHSSRKPTLKNLAKRFGVSQDTVRQWRRTPGYSARKVATYRVWRQAVNGRIDVSEVPFALREALPTEIKRLDLGTAKSAIAATQIGGEQRFAIYNVFVACAIQGNPLPDDLKAALAVGLGLVSVEYKRSAYAGQ